MSPPLGVRRLCYHGSGHFAEGGGDGGGNGKRIRTTGRRERRGCKSEEMRRGMPSRSGFLTGFLRVGLPSSQEGSPHFPGSNDCCQENELSLG